MKNGDINVAICTVILALVQSNESTSTATSSPATTRIRPLIVSAPFGNYIQPRDATATLGTFTAEARPGRLWRIIKTVRYYPRLRAWVNKIGLRNPGMPALVREVNLGRTNVSDKIVSIHGFNDTEWQSLLEQIVEIGPTAVELNMSCPNVGEMNWPATLFRDAVEQMQQAGGRTRVIVKLPPVRYETMAKQAIEAGVTWFHCCNTLPVPAGGVSGKPLKPVALACIGAIRTWPEAEQLTIIGGGGISKVQDIDDYIDAGVQHVAIGTVTMNPLLLITHAPIDGLVDHAIARLG